MKNRAKYIAVTIIALTAVLILVVVTGRLAGDREPHFDPPRDLYPMSGIDISAHNGEIDFDKVAADGVDFVYAKASEGNWFRDKRFISNYIGARKAGMKVGAYHFFRFDCDGDRQGLNFLAAVSRLPLDLPMAIDVEEWGNPVGYSTEEVVHSLRRMIFRLESEGRRVMIYTNRNGYNRFVRGRFEELPVWVCAFADPPIDNAGWTLWQHSHQSRINGIAGDVDLNTFNGDSLQWEKWLADMK